jgi:hypothetical protein
MVKLFKDKHAPFMKAITLIVLMAFCLTSLPSLSYAEGLLGLPAPGTPVPLSSGFIPTILRGIRTYPNNPFEFDFIVDVGDAKLAGEAFTKETEKLVKYFLASLTMPEDDLWVNLSPYEKDRIVPESFGQTEMGRDLLAQDYLLKQITASLISPDTDLGKEFWAKVYKKAYEQFGTTNIPVNTFNKVWIVPEKAVVYEQGPSTQPGGLAQGDNKQAAVAFIVESKLKVMLEEDYVATQESQKSEVKSQSETQKSDASSFLPDTKYQIPDTVSSSIVREIVIPELEKEVNTGKNFAPLRQIYSSLILATWFKETLKNSILNKKYSNQKKIKGLEVNGEEKNQQLDTQSDVQKIYSQYLAAYKKGVCDMLKIEYDPYARKAIPRKYFSGGFGLETVKNKLQSIYILTANFLKDLPEDSKLVNVRNSPEAVPGAGDQGGPAIVFAKGMTQEDADSLKVNSKKSVVPQDENKRVSRPGFERIVKERTSKEFSSENEEMLIKAIDELIHNAGNESQEAPVEISLAEANGRYFLELLVPPGMESEDINWKMLLNNQERFKAQGPAAMLKENREKFDGINTEAAGYEGGGNGFDRLGRLMQRLEEAGGLNIFLEYQQLDFGDHQGIQTHLWLDVTPLLTSASSTINMARVKDLAQQAARDFDNTKDGGCHIARKYIFYNLTGKQVSQDVQEVNFYVPFDFNHPGNGQSVAHAISRVYIEGMPYIIDTHYLQFERNNHFSPPEGFHEMGYVFPESYYFKHMQAFSNEGLARRMTAADQDYKVSDNAPAQSEETIPPEVVGPAAPGTQLELFDKDGKVSSSGLASKIAVVTAAGLMALATAVPGVAQIMTLPDTAATTQQGIPGSQPSTPAPAEWKVQAVQDLENLLLQLHYLDEDFKSFLYDHFDENSPRLPTYRQLMLEMANMAGQIDSLTNSLAQKGVPQKATLAGIQSLRDGISRGQKVIGQMIKDGQGKGQPAAVQDRSSLYPGDQYFIDALKKYGVEVRVIQSESEWKKIRDHHKTLPNVDGFYMTGDTIVAQGVIYMNGRIMENNCPLAKGSLLAHEAFHAFQRNNKADPVAAFKEIYDLADPATRTLLQDLEKFYEKFYSYAGDHARSLADDEILTVLYADHTSGSFDFYERVYAGLGLTAAIRHPDNSINTNGAFPVVYRAARQNQALWDRLTKYFTQEAGAFFAQPPAYAAPQEAGLGQTDDLTALFAMNGKLDSLFKTLPQDTTANPASAAKAKNKTPGSARTGIVGDKQWTIMSKRLDGKSGTGAGEFNNPVGIAKTPDGHVIILEQGGNRLQEWSPEKGFELVPGPETQGLGNLQIEEPYSGKSMFVASNGDIYVFDTGNQRLLKYSSGKWEKVADQITNFQDMCVTSNGDIFILRQYREKVEYKQNKYGLGSNEHANWQILKLNKDENKWDVFKKQGDFGDPEEVAWGINVDKDNFLYISLSWNSFRSEINWTGNLKYDLVKDQKEILSEGYFPLPHPYFEDNGRIYGLDMEWSAKTYEVYELDPATKEWTLILGESNLSNTPEPGSFKYLDGFVVVDGEIWFVDSRGNTVQRSSLAPKPAALKEIPFTAIAVRDGFIPESRKPVRESYLIVPGIANVRTAENNILYFDYQNYDPNGTEPTRVLLSWGSDYRMNNEYNNQQHNLQTGLVRYFTKEQYEGKNDFGNMLKKSGLYKVLATNGKWIEYSGAATASVDLATPRSEMFDHGEKALQLFNDRDFAKTIEEFKFAIKSGSQVLEKIKANKPVLEETLSNLDEILKETISLMTIYQETASLAAAYINIQKAEDLFSATDYIKAEEQFRLAQQALVNVKNSPELVNYVNNAIKTCQANQALGETALSGDETLPPGLPGADMQGLHHSEVTYAKLKRDLARGLGDRPDKQELIDEAVRRLDDVHYSQRTPELLAANAQKIADRILAREGIAAPAAVSSPAVSSTIITVIFPSSGVPVAGTKIIFDHEVGCFANAATGRGIYPSDEPIDLSANNSVRVIKLADNLMELEVYQGFGRDRTLVQRYRVASSNINENKTTAKMDNESVGGVDFKPANLNLERWGNAIQFDLSDQDLENIQIDALYPVIINIAPITDLPMLLGAGEESMEPQLSKLQ